MGHITYNTVVPHLVVEDYGFKVDRLGRISAFKQKLCTIGKHKNELVWVQYGKDYVPKHILDKVLAR